MNDSHLNASFPCNFISKVLGKPVVEAELPSDIDYSLQFAYSMLSSPNVEKVINWSFKDGLPRVEIAKKLQRTPGYIYNLLNTTVKELTLGNRTMLFTHGYAYCVDNKIVGPWLLDLEQKVDPDLYLDLYLFDLGLTTRILHCLYRWGIKTVRELTQYTEQDLSRIPGLGPAAIMQIKTRLSEWGGSLATIQP